MYLLADTQETFGGGGGGVFVPAIPTLPTPDPVIPPATVTLPSYDPSSLATTISTLGNLASGLIQSTSGTPSTATVPFIQQTQTTNTSMLDKIKTYINNNALTCVIVALIAGVAGGIYYMKSKKRR
jgi:hypothetical protein